MRGGMRIMLKARQVALAIVTMVLASPSAQASPYDQVVGIQSVNGGALLVKRVPVTAGSTIVGAEVVTNDLRTTFPKVTLYRGRGARLSDVTVIREFTNVRASTRHHIMLSCPPIQVPAAQDFYVAVTWPASDGVRGLRDGAAIPATLRSEGGESFIAAGPDKELQRIEGLDLGVRLILEGGVAKSADSEQLPARVWRTFFTTDGSGGGQPTFRFGIERKALVSLAIYDVSGRAVKIILREEFEPGEYVRPWDGRNDSGAQVASGVYIAKFVAGDRTLSQKVVVTR
jgi:hypothetical protein